MDLGLRTGRAEMRTRSFFFVAKLAFFCRKIGVFLSQNRRFCKTNIAKLCKNIQKNAKICKKICIYQKKVLSLQRISEESRNEPQRVNQ